MRRTEEPKTAPRMTAGVNVACGLALAACALAVLIAVSAHAQDNPAAGPTVPAPDGTRQHLVPSHFDAQGKYVPQHYETTKPLHFRGYFAADAQKRAADKQHGYQEPAPQYTTPIDPSTLQPMEGR